MKSKVVNPDQIRLNAAIISDTHIDTRPGRAVKLTKGLRDMENARTPYDVLVTVGDMTDHGYPEHWKVVDEIYAGKNPAKKILFVLGNHDRWTKEDEPCDYRELFKKYSQKICKRELDELWFSDKINGYTFISLADDDRETGVNDKQLKWFAGQMDAASKDGKPIFVFMHESINVSHGLPYTWNRKWQKNDTLPNCLNSGIGKRSDEVEKLLSKYKNVFFFSGHIHLGLTENWRFRKYGFSVFETVGSLHRINVPCFMFPNHHGLPFSGIGYQLEIYDDKVLIRARNYVHSFWVRSHVVEFPIEKWSAII